MDADTTTPVLRGGDAIRRCVRTRPDRSRIDPCLPWIGRGVPDRTPGNDGQASSVIHTSLWKAGRDQKSPFRRCFKSRPLRRAEWAGFASGCRLVKNAGNNRLRMSGGQTGLLSGIPPTGTRPQARAKLGKSSYKAMLRISQAPAQSFCPVNHHIPRISAMRLNHKLAPQTEDKRFFKLDL